MRGIAVHARHDSRRAAVGCARSGWRVWGLDPD